MIGYFYGWPHGAVWSNVLVIPVIAVLAWAWARTKFWPLRPLEHAVKRLRDRQDEHNQWMAEHIARIHAHLIGPADPHPHFPDRKEAP